MEGDQHWGYRVLGMVALCPLFAVPALWDAPSPILINLYATNQGANGKLIRQLR